MSCRGSAYVDLYWLPLGAGGHFVRLNGRIYETLAAALRHRARRRLYHSALEVGLGPATYTIEMAPVWSEAAPERGVMGEGAVGSPFAGRWRLFRYEIRRWPGGRIPDVSEAVDSPQRLTTEPRQARAVLELVEEVPTPTWGRDELHTGEMWNSNSVVSWLLVRAGLGTAGARLPVGGRAPGWDAGVVASRRAENRWARSVVGHRTIAATGGSVRPRGDRQSGYRDFNQPGGAMRKSFEVGGFIAAAVLIAFGIGAIVIGANGRATVHSNLKQEQIVGTPDMTPRAIAAEAKGAGLKGVSLPTKAVAGQTIDNGSKARTFAGYMRIHALEATGGMTYAQMPHFATADGKGTDNAAQALKKNGQPVDNPARGVWVNETALATALNASYMAEQTALFGIALLLTGLGFGVLAGAGALRNREAPAAALARRTKPVDTSLAVPSA